MVKLFPLPVLVEVLNHRKHTFKETGYTPDLCLVSSNLAERFLTETGCKLPIDLVDPVTGENFTIADLTERRRERK